MSLLSRRASLPLSAPMMAILLSACSAGHPPAPPLPPMADTAALTMVDTDFVQKLNEMNLAQIALAKVAQTHAGRSDLANLSTTITKDLTGNQDRLTALAAGHGITLTTRPTATDEKAIAQLQKLHGTGFDRAYAHALSGNTARMTPIINSEIATTKNTDLSKLASDTRTMLAAYQNGI